MGKKNKIRRLGQGSTTSTKQSQKRTFSIYFTIVTLGIAFVSIFVANPMLWNDFLHSYKEQYNSIVHNTPDYCVRPLDTTKIFTELKSKVINQDEALKRMENSLRNQSNIISIALTGPTGVGKTFLKEILLEQFPWREHIQQYVWSTYSEQLEMKTNKLDDFLNNLSDCGQNLIVIDDLLPKDKEFVEFYSSKAEMTVMGNLHQNRSLKLILIYIFNLQTFSDTQRQNYDKHFNLLQNLKNIETINLRMFNESDLLDCIRNESENLNISLSVEQLDEISKSIDVRRGGCKNVYSKVLMYRKF